MIRKLKLQLLRGFCDRGDGNSSSKTDERGIIWQYCSITTSLLLATHGPIAAKRPK
jgi:hypothetical protein